MKVSSYSKEGHMTIEIIYSDLELSSTIVLLIVSETELNRVMMSNLCPKIASEARELV